MSTKKIGHSVMNFPPLETCTVAVIGLGYVGLPLAVELAKPQACLRTGEALRRRVIGFDINTQRLEELQQGIDRTKETSVAELKAAELLEFTSEPEQLAQADVFVVTVPTPIDSAKRPDLTPLQKASATVGKALRARAQRLATRAEPITTPIVIYESTVYPGATEEVCVPILEQESGLRFNEGFGCGYSPERINPGDCEHRLTTITKVTSGSTPAAAAWVDAFYGSIIKAGTHPAASLKVAEAAKVIENTQRDLNICSRPLAASGTFYRSGLGLWADTALVSTPITSPTRLSSWATTRRWCWRAGVLTMGWAPGWWSSWCWQWRVAAW